MIPAALLTNALLVGAGLFCLGLVGILTRRNLIVMFLCAELMLQGVAVTLVAWSRFHGDPGGQTLVVFVLTVAACEAAVALVFVLQAFARTGRLDASAWQALREENLPRVIDRELPAGDAAAPNWPRLTPAGVRPQRDASHVEEREHV
jgi:NADH-quinone oxidoreductase subunit K